MQILRLLEKLVKIGSDYSACLVYSCIPLTGKLLLQSLFIDRKQSLTTAAQPVPSQL
jgi:hypothetical protein